MTDDVQRSLGRIEGQNSQILALLGDVKAKQVTDSARIGSLERSRAGLWGAFAAAKAAILTLGYVIFKG